MEIQPKTPPRITMRRCTNCKALLYSGNCRLLSLYCCVTISPVWTLNTPIFFCLHSIQWCGVLIYSCAMQSFIERNWVIDFLIFWMHWVCQYLQITWETVDQPLIYQYWMYFDNSALIAWTHFLCEHVIIFVWHIDCNFS